ncbi:MAG: anthranilate phosphoribosyltransferase [Proteobacteria bacterium]|nr:anthranilate phosphoribosyltransferase [Pseudomonadota bacterium]
MAARNAWLDKACRGSTLDRAEARAAMDHLVSGEADPAQIAGLLCAIEARGVRAEELTGFAQSLRSHALTVKIERTPLIDTCGTGGDGLQTFNISTAAAFVAAGAGVGVAKHGNRSVSSKCGSADVLEALGVPVEGDLESVRASLEETGFGFFFAPKFHPAVRHVSGVRKALGVRTVFNLLGPMVNPAPIRRQVVGIYSEPLLETYASVLLALGLERAMVVRGEDGMDELSLCGRTVVCHAEAGRPVRKEILSPEDAGLRRASADSLRGSDAAGNAKLLVEVLEGRSGPLLDATLYNAGAAVWIAGLAEDLKEGVASARASVSSGRARGILEKLRGKKP